MITRGGRGSHRRAWRHVSWGAILIAANVMAISVWARHDVLYPGTVVRLEAVTLSIRHLDEKTRKEQTLEFTVTATTIFRRGSRQVPRTDASIVAGERVVVVVNHDAEVKSVATEVRLAAK